MGRTHSPRPGTRVAAGSSRRDGLVGIARRALLLATLLVLAYGYIPIAIGYGAAQRELAAVQLEIAGLRVTVADLEERLDPHDGSFDRGR